MPITVSHQERVGAEHTVIEKTHHVQRLQNLSKSTQSIVIYTDERTSEAINYQVELASRW